VLVKFIREKLTEDVSSNIAETCATVVTRLDSLVTRILPDCRWALSAVVQLVVTERWQAAHPVRDVPADATYAAKARLAKWKPVETRPCQHEPPCAGTWQHYRKLEADGVWQPGHTRHLAS
jgi:hypothetical protein